MLNPNESVNETKTRKSLVFLGVFVLGVGVGYGLFFLDQQARVPRLESTEVFEVTLPDGTIQRLSYAEIERGRQELTQLRQRLARSERTPPPSAAPRPAAPGANAGSAASPPELQKKPAEPDKGRTEDSKKKLGELFSKIFNQSVMTDLVQSQVKRQVNELTAVLTLNPEQQKALQDLLDKRQKSRFGQQGAAAAREPAGDEATPAKPVEEEIRALLTPEQSRRYQEYTDKKNSVRGSPVDKEIFELTWRLSLNEDQEAKAREILQEHANNAQNVAAITAGEDNGDVPYTKRIEEYLAARDAQDKRTAEKMETVLTPAQMKGFVEFQHERDLETQLFRKLLQEEAAKETQPPTP